MAPIIKDDSLNQPYHERHEMTSMYKCLGEIKIAEQNSLIEDAKFNELQTSIKKLLTDLAAEDKSDDELIDYLNKNFEAITQEERTKSY
jgi:hypothetical protein